MPVPKDDVSDPNAEAEFIYAKELRHWEATHDKEILK